ncbi:hydrogenase expression/formation protein HypE [Desulfurispirillum indicum]|uniref:hydrogenase expression/formation protein HypE n=1 Tax=Desulfurispirillum indicum TaxID=936456 RepID=UPI001CFACC39|nr:hydrogenase expression/formation protein HypE [Desulfurispirillum indicum]UCZ57969.1 hydrogenase expression/formation protein HypE [Desulfurispirillum indicum]
MKESIQLAHGGGAAQSAELIRELFFRYFSNEILLQAEDAAVLPMSGGKLAFTTDGFTVSPRQFPGGDIGKLAVCGTCNDLAMMGARPRYMSAGFILEEGFALSELEALVRSMAEELAHNGCQIVTGDTKVVPRGSADGLYITTSAVGSVEIPSLSAAALQPGHRIVVSGPVGDHGTVIFAQREGMDLQTDLVSDCASLWPAVQEIIQSGIPLVAMRDATRGGLSAVLHEWAQQSSVSLTVQQDAIPVRPEVLGICELLGFEPYHLANEGTFVLAVEARHAAELVEVLRTKTACHQASIIGEVCEGHQGKVILETAWGTRRFMEMGSGELLPRIC